MTLQLIRATVSPEHVSSVDAALQDLFADSKASYRGGSPGRRKPSDST